jgi:hypothetical protein
MKKLSILILTLASFGFFGLGSEASEGQHSNDCHSPGFGCAAKVPPLAESQSPDSENNADCASWLSHLSRDLSGALLPERPHRHNPD